MDHTQTKTIWKNALESIKLSVSPAIFTTWFSQTFITSLKDTPKRSLVEIGCNSSFVKTTLESRYFGMIQDTLSNILEKPCDILFVVKENPDLKQTNGNDNSPLFSQEDDARDNLRELLEKTRVRERFNFDNFAVSSSNQMAWAAAEAVSKSPGDAYNPLFIWGGVGVGKTHLMNAIGYSIIKDKDSSKVLFCTGEEFTNEIVEGIRNKSTQQFRNKYRKLKALMIDDIQFIAGKDAVQEEFFHTFNALVASGSQVLLTSDRPPSEISKLEERLRSRFEAGLIVDIAPPDFELRCAIIQIKTKERGIDLPMDMVQIIAGNLDSARQIQGFLVRLMSESKLKNIEISANLIESLLGKGILGDQVQSIRSNPQDVIKAISNYYSIGKRALLGPSRARTVSIPRQILMYMLRVDLGISLQEVGRVVGGRDHTTVMHAVDKITRSASQDVSIREDIRGIKNLL